jgi:DNA-binding MarR family transcriptional regulator
MDAGRRGERAAQPGRAGGSPTRASPPDLEAPLGYLIVRVAERLDRAFTARLAAVNLTGRELHVLRYLRAAGPMSHGELSGAIAVDAANLIETIDRLEQAALIHRRIDPRDRRRREIKLTARGSRRLQAGLRAAEQAEDDVLGTLDAAQLERLREMMLHVYKR